MKFKRIQKKFSINNIIIIVGLFKMGLLDYFKQKKNTENDPISDLTLKNLKIGWILDYDMKSWQVKSCSCYDWGDGDITYEWQLVSHDDTIYLEREIDDEDYFSISRKIPFGKIDKGLKDYIIKNNDPPNEITYENKQYYQEEMGGGHFFIDITKLSIETGREVLKWDFEAESGNEFISIERWGESDFEATFGKSVELYQFSNILPSN